MSATRRSRCWLVIATLMLSLAGCGHVLRVGPTGTLNLALNEYRITPRAAVTDSGVLTVVVRNYGRLSHNLVISSDGVPKDATRAIPPGGEATLYLDLSAGVYQLDSTLLDDNALGLRGTLTVRNPS